MAKSINKVILIGNLGRDPEIKQTSSGTRVAKFSLATSERFKGKGGEWQERTEWHNIVAWQRLAEIVGEYTKQGAKVYVEGRLQTSTWEDKQRKEVSHGNCRAGTSSTRRARFESLRGRRCKDSTTSIAG